VSQDGAVSVQLSSNYLAVRGASAGSREDSLVPGGEYPESRPRPKDVESAVMGLLAVVAAVLTRSSLVGFGQADRSPVETASLAALGARSDFI